MKLIETKTVTTAQTTVTFSDIPQNFQDLYVLSSLRDTSGTAGWATAEIRPNGSSSNLSSRALYGFGTTVGGLTTAEIYHQATQGGNTANTFSSSSVQIFNYTAAKPKQISVDTVTEGNIANTITALTTGQWNSTAPITSLSFVMASGASFAPGSTISVYGIGGAGDGYAAPKATGGIISYTPGYVVHTFTASGTFTPTANLTDVEYLVIAGGGGGGQNRGGAGGAGGYRSSVVGQSSGGGGSAESRLSLTSGVGYTVTIGAGGAGGNGGSLSVAGSNSVFSTITSTGGGRGGGYQNNVNQYGGTSGGSGGGGSGHNSPGFVAGAGTANQGFNGGASVSTGGGGGGGGAGAVGGAGVSLAAGQAAGNGGTGVASNITGTSVTRAGGGGGGSPSGTAGTANGGGGAGGQNAAGTSGTSNTGGGGGGSGSQNDFISGGNGGSGIVIVRYAA